MEARWRLERTKLRSWKRALNSIYAMYHKPMVTNMHHCLNIAPEGPLTSGTKPGELPFPRILSHTADVAIVKFCSAQSDVHCDMPTRISVQTAELRQLNTHIILAITKESFCGRCDQWHYWGATSAAWMLYCSTEALAVFFFLIFISKLRRIK